MNTRLDKRVLSTTTNRASVEGDSYFSQPHLRNGRPVSTPKTSLLRGVFGGDTMCDAQADVPSARRLRAQLAFKNSMVHGILQFTPSIAFCYVLHRCVSRDIRCRESFVIIKKQDTLESPRTVMHGTSPFYVYFSLAHSVPGVVVLSMYNLGAQRANQRSLSTRHPRYRTMPNTKDTIVLLHVHGSFCCAGFDNDPSAGSPTETLLRLLLPLNDKVQWNSRDVAGGEPPTSPRS